MLKYDVVQALVRDDSGERFNIPMFYYPEMLLFAMGMESDRRLFDMHRTKVKPVLDAIQGDD